MDIDVALQHDFRDDPDEDLIDYDDDVVEQQEPQTQPNQTHGSAHETSSLNINSSEQLQPVIPLSDSKDVDFHEEKAQFHRDAVTNDLTSKMTQVTGVDGDEIDVEQQVIDLPFSPGALNNDNGFEGGNDDAGDAGAFTTRSKNDFLHEIDYDNQDNTQNMQGTPSHLQGGVNTETLQSEQEITSGPLMSGAREGPAEAPSAYQQEADIDWENELVEVDKDSVGTDYVSEETHTVEVGFNEATENVGENLQGDDVAWHAVEHDDEILGEEDDRYGDSTVEKLANDEVVDEPSQTVSETPDDTYVEESAFPNVRVQYRGEEFPMFSSSSNGFFSEISFLDVDMKALMAGFRAELCDDVSADDELVFQIDELGLDIAESRVQDTLSAVTLRQILEIFDLLVKNQNPDSSRALYTYLFTKPNTNKRFDFLCESAAAGKGLDEVIQLFESSIPHGTQLGLAKVIDNNNKHLDSRESSADDRGDNNQMPSGVDEQYVAEEDFTAENGHEDHGINEHTSGEVYEQVAAVQEVNGLDHAAEMIEQGVNVGSASDELFANLEEHDPDIAQRGTSSLELEEGLVGLARDAAESAEADDATLSGMNNSSTTNTIQDDAEANLDTLDEVLAQEAADDILQQGLEEQGQFNEIDWQDDGASEAPPEDALPGSGKRDHADAELGTEDEKDVKRRRS